MTALARQSRLSYRVSVCANPILKMDHTRLVAMIRSSHRTAGEGGEGERDMFIFEYIYMYIYICVCVYVYIYSEREREEERERERARERVAHRSSSRLLKVFQETCLDGGGCRGFCSFRAHSAVSLQSCLSGDTCVFLTPPCVLVRGLHQPAGLDQVDDFRSPTSWLAKAKVPLLDGKTLRFLARAWSNPKGC